MADDKVFVQLASDVDYSYTPKLEEQMHLSIDAGIRIVSLDFAKTRYIDSAGVGFILRIFQRLSDLGGTLIITELDPQVLHVLSLIGLLDTAPSIEIHTKRQDIGKIDQSIRPLKTWSMRVPPDLEQMQMVREKVVEWLGATCLSSDAVFMLKTAFGEALTNALVHGHQPGEEALVTVNVQSFPAYVRVAIIDRGPCFALPEGEVEMDIRATEGRGLMMMRLLLDEVAVVPNKRGGCVVTLVKCC